MAEINQFKEDTLNEFENLDMNFKREGHCVCINIFNKCDDKKSFKKKQKCCKDKKEKQDCCVCINIVTECEN